MSNTVLPPAIAPASPLSPEYLAELREKFLATPELLGMQNAVTRVGVEDVAVNHARVVSLSTTVSHRLDDWAVANQKQSGRCWLFAALNLFRAGTKKKLGVKEFEFSQNHAMYWDKLERANYFLEDMIATADLPVQDRLVAFLLDTVVGDGGQWNMAVSIFQKHGVVPKEAMPETFSSSNTRAMNHSLQSYLRQGARTLREMVLAGSSADSLASAKEEIVEGIHRILTVHLGTPPTEFLWQWRDDEQEFHRDGVITPQEFFEKYVTIPVADYVCLVDDPRPEHGKGSVLTVEHLGNVVGGDPVRYLNVDIAQMKELAKDAILNGEPVWFGCDVGQQMQRKDGIWAADLLDYPSVYGVDFALDKEGRVRYGDSLMTHAMLLTGVDLRDDGSISRWRVENSWGDENADKGYYTMDDSWFDEYVFEVVVNRAGLPAPLRSALDSEPISLPAWDPMGALA